MILILGPTAPLGTAAPTASDAERITLDFKDVELTDLIKTVSELTGKNFLYDEKVKGKVTIVSPETMTLDETYQLFLTVLNVKGYTLVPSGKVNKVVPIKNAKQEGLPVYSGGRGGSSEQFITRLVRLDYLDVDTIATSILEPLMPATGNIITYPPTNTLILTESAATIDRMVKIMQQLDQPGSTSSLKVLPLRNANAEEVARICKEVLAQPSTPAKTRASKTLSSAKGAVTRIIPYSRTNTLIILSGAEDLATIRNLVALLDQQTDGGQSYINVYYLENADAETLAATLNQILTGIKAQAKQPGAQGAKGQTPLSSEPVTITADKPTNALVINAKPEDYALLKNIIQKLDIKRKQVYVEALILELSMDATQKIGASLSGAIDVGNDSVVFGSSNLNAGSTNLGSFSGGDSGTPSLLGQTIEGILLGGLFNPITVTGLDGNPVTIPALSALIDLSKKDSDINILSAPRLLTSDNEEAEIIVGSNVPIITERLTDTGGSGLAQSVSVERKDVALTLRFTPQVTEGNLVRLNVFQEITDLASSSVGDINEVGPTLTKRLVRNTVLARNGRTVVLGGLIGTSVQEVVSKTPILGDIPGLGWLFKYKSTTKKKTNLLIFITPTIINNPEDLSAVTRKNKDAARGFMTDELREALPQDFNSPQPPPDDLSITPDAQEEKPPQAVEGTVPSSGKPSGDHASWATPRPQRGTTD
jgi:general secretion pathway protein D